MIVLLMLWTVPGALAQDTHNHDRDHADEQQVEESHDGHDHDLEHVDEQQVEESHDGHVHGEDPAHGSPDDNGESADDAVHDDHEGHSDALTIELTPEAVTVAGITIARVTRGRIGKTIEMPGEVGFNEDRLAHIAPRFPGVAVQVNYRVGDFVEVGDIVATIESNESMNFYSIIAPISGWVIERHITPGEFVSEQASIYVIADLSTVWVNLAVYPGDADLVKKGQVAQINAIGTENVATGPIEYVTPIVDPRTRSLTARIILANPNNAWRPGTFVRAAIVSESGDESLVVERNAVQYLIDESVVFVVDGPNKFRPVQVVAGDSDDRYTQIISGLSEGTEYVSKGAFELKAKVVTSNLDAHAGHGH